MASDFTHFSVHSLNVHLNIAYRIIAQFNFFFRFSFSQNYNQKFHVDRALSIPSFHTPEAHINIVKLLQSPFLSIKIIFIDRIDKIIAVQQAIYTVSSKRPFVVWTTTIRQSSKKHRSQITSNLTIRDSLANVDFSFQIEDITK